MGIFQPAMLVLFHFLKMILGKAFGATMKLINSKFTVQTARWELPKITLAQMTIEDTPQIIINCTLTTGGLWFTRFTRILSQRPPLWTIQLTEEILHHLLCYEILWKLGYSPYQLVKDVFHQQHVSRFLCEISSKKCEESFNSRYECG